MSEEWTAEKFEPAVEEELEDNTYYCVYCFEEQNDKLSCCSENHFLTGKELKEYEKELNKRMTKQETKGIVYDPPMSGTDEYLLKKQREEEHRSNDY